MPRSLKIQNQYRTTITEPTIAASGDITFTVTSPPTYSNGFLVVSPDNAALREIMYYDRVVGNTIYVYGQNRYSPKGHSQNETVQINDVAEIFNTYSDLASQAFYIEKKSGLNVTVWGGYVSYNQNQQSFPDTDLVLTNNTTNYIKYDFPSNTLSVGLTDTGNVKAVVVTSGGLITSVVNRVSKESYIDFTVALNTALPPQPGNTGRILGTDGTNASWVDKLPSQTGHNGKVLSTDGITESWQNVSVGNIKNSDYITGESLSSGNTVVIEKIDKLNITTEYGNATNYSQGDFSTTFVASGANYYGVRITTSSTKHIYAVRFMTNTPLGGLGSWRLTQDGVGTLASGAINSLIETLVSPIQIGSGQTYRIEVTYASNWNLPYNTGVTLPVVTAPITWAGNSQNGANGGGTTIQAIRSIDTYEVIDVFTNIGDVIANSRYSISGFGTGASSNTVNLQLKKTGTPFNLGVRIETDNAGNPSGTLADPNANASIAHTSITTSKSNITITFAGNFILNANTKYHIVLLQGTYGSETINAGSYYSVTYDGDLSAQISKKWNGSIWSANSGRRTFVSSNLFVPILLKKTNATTAYGAYCDGIVESAFSEGQPVTMVTYGQTKVLTGLTERLKYYLSNTPGAISTSPGTITRAVGTAKQPGLFDIGFYLTT